MKYLKKPILIDCVEFKGWSKLGESHKTTTSEYPKWLQQAFENKTITYLPEHNRIDISTLEGVMQVKVGDFIIKGIQGEIYPCKPDIFAETYERGV